MIKNVSIVNIGICTIQYLYWFSDMIQIQQTERNTLNEIIKVILSDVVVLQFITHDVLLGPNLISLVSLKLDGGFTSYIYENPWGITLLAPTKPLFQMFQVQYEESKTQAAMRTSLSWPAAVCNWWWESCWTCAQGVCSTHQLIIFYRHLQSPIGTRWLSLFTLKKKSLVALTPLEAFGIAGNATH